MDIKILVATHKAYKMPNDRCYLPVHVGKEGKSDIGYVGDNTGDNISNKNPYYCELTGLYWGVKNLECDYIGLVHYRRHFSKKGFLSNLFRDKFDRILSQDEMEIILKDYDIILPKKRKYYIETLYSHYGNTHYSEHLDETRAILERLYPEYVGDFDKVMKRTSAHMFNMFIMKKELADNYCEWLFSILSELEEKIDFKQYNAFQARLFGRVSELLLDVWIENNQLKYKEVSCMHMEKLNMLKKVISFLKAKFLKEKYKGSF
ncbi:DUF4422 domain-containing protein [Clostridium sp. HCS.1]|uniref:DUF4422 domain-containing protein n=1 Tax=Clostridium sp. HCS.1 TaxID=3238594 RepID=UPI003A0FB84F